MRILLVFPPQSGKERYGKLSKAGSYLPPMGLASLAAVIEPEHEVRIIDGSILLITLDDLKKEIAEWKPDVVGVSALTPTYYRAVDVCKTAKAVDPSIVTVLGGPHPSSLPMPSMEDISVDFAVIGEGEETFKEFLQHLERGEDLSSVKGLLLRMNGEVIATGQRPPIANLDSLPMPARHLLPMHLYHPSLMHYKRLPAFSVMCGRGCPFKCTFCSCSKVFPGKMRLRTPEGVIEEIRHLVDKYGAREILIWDDLFGLSKDWTRKFCELIAPFKLTWSAWMRVDIVEPDLLKLMANSGCWNISYGVEAGNQKVLDDIKKGFKVEQVKKAFKWTHEAGMEARATFILGLPKDTPKTMKETVDLAIEIDADYAQFQMLTPYPGSEIWDTVKEGRTTDDLSKYTIWFPVFVPPGLTEEELSRAHSAAYRRFYFRAGYIWGRIKRLRSLSDIYRYLIGGMSVLSLIGKKGGNKATGES